MRFPNTNFRFRRCLNLGCVRRIALAPTFFYSSPRKRTIDNDFSDSQTCRVNDDRFGGNDFALLEAVERGDIDSVCRLVKAGARLDVADDKGKTPLHVAVSIKAVCHGAGALGAKMLRFLHENGADINAVDKAGHTPCYEAFVSLLIRATTALFFASYAVPSGAGRIPYTSISLGERALDTFVDLGADTRCVCDHKRVEGISNFGETLSCSSAAQRKIRRATQNVNYIWRP